MNLFCFSLEGSTDSLYEPVQTAGTETPKPVPSRASSRPCSRSCSPAVLLDNDTKWRGSGRSISMEMPQTHRTNSNRSKRTHMYKSASDNEILDNPVCNTAEWQTTRSRDDLVHFSNNQNQEMRKTKHRTETKRVKGVHQTGTRKKERPPSNQSSHVNGVMAESKPAVKRNHKSGKKPAGRSGKEGLRKSQKSTGKPASSPSDPTSPPPPTGTHYLDVPYRSDRRPYQGKSSTLPAHEHTARSRCPDVLNLPGGATPTHAYHQRWSNPGEGSPSWGGVQHTCRRPLTEYRACSQDLGTSTETVQGQDHRLKPESKSQVPTKVPRSITDVDLTQPNRSTSFGRFDGLRHQSSPAKAEDNGTNVLTEDCESPDPHKSAGLGKKMKAISLTMRRKMGKKHAKSFCDDTGDDTDKDTEAETENNPSAEKTPANSCNSLESLYSAQSASSGVTGESVGSGQKDAARQEENASYQGPFCGRARVHTDFVPSPYDTDSLKLKSGDIINIISKPPMGIWTGMLNNKVGNFKFIYVDVLVEKEEEEEEEDKEEEETAPKIRQKLCRRPRPKTLLEFLERLHLQEYASALLLNGYQTVEDLTHLQEKHLIELNVGDPEHRRRLLAAADCRYIEGDDLIDAEEQESSHSQQEEDSDCPRDSGCFIPSECSDSKEDTEQLADTAEA